MKRKKQNKNADLVSIEKDAADDVQSYSLNVRVDSTSFFILTLIDSQLISGCVFYM